MKIVVATPNTSVGITGRLAAAARLVASPGTEIRDSVPVPLVDGIEAAVTIVEGLVRLDPHEGTSGTYRWSGPKDPKGLSQALANVVGHRDT